MKLNHIDLQTTDVRATAAFFERHFGFTPRSNPGSDAIAILAGDDGFLLVLQRMPPGERHPAGFHVGFHVDDDALVLDARRRLAADGVEVGEVVRNGRGTLLYCYAPGGILVEIAHPRRVFPSAASLGSVPAPPRRGAMASTGQNVWFDLMTTDMEGAKAFYTEVLGWKTQQWSGGDPNMPYTMWAAGETTLGGVMPLPADAQKMGAPPHWVAYTVVDDVDAATAKAEKLGARVYAPPMDIPNVGRFSMLGDPQGATFAMFKPAGDMPAPPDSVGHFSWAELNTTDYEAAWKFYSELFGWKHRSSMDMGPMGTYFMFQDPEEKTKGGMSNVAKAMNMPAHWLHYVTVDDIDAAVERVKKAGGKVMNGPMEIPGNDVIAQCQDPQGGFFAIYAHKK